jgi:hypothetical protein
MANTSAIFKGAYTKLLTALGLKLETGQKIISDTGVDLELEAATGQDIVLTGEVSGTAIKDEDDLSSNSDKHVATQQSIKSYVDGKTIETALNSGLSGGESLADGTVTLELDVFNLSVHSGDAIGTDSVALNKGGSTGQTTVSGLSPGINHDVLENYVAEEHIRWDITGAEDINDDRIAQSSVTQHESALSISTTQLVDDMPDARIVESNVTQHEAALSVATTQLTGALDGGTSA